MDRETYIASKSIVSAILAADAGYCVSEDDKLDEKEYTPEQHAALAEAVAAEVSLNQVENLEAVILRVKDIILDREG